MSNDPNVYIYSGTLIQRIARALLLLLITLLLLMPIVVCNIISTTSIRILVVIVSTISYLLVLSLLTKSRSIELILAGATYVRVQFQQDVTANLLVSRYAAVLTVFVTGTSVTQG